MYRSLGDGGHLSSTFAKLVHPYSEAWVNPEMRRQLRTALMRQILILVRSRPTLHLLRLGERPTEWL